MELDLLKVREEFEAWFVDMCLQKGYVGMNEVLTYLDLSDKNDLYYYESTQTHWEAWESCAILSNKRFILYMESLKPRPLDILWEEELERMKHE